MIVSEIAEDLDGDGHAEQIKLIVTPAPVLDPQGNYLWDDSHVWQLSVEDQEGTYLLFEEHVTGMAELFLVYNEDLQGNEVVLLIQGMDLALHSFSYRDGDYIQDVKYNRGPVAYRSGSANAK